jgi:hypothetical protein
MGLVRDQHACRPPVQGRTKYEPVINSKTAKALSLTNPTLARADEVIE